jgi:hypothetical protein
MIALVVFGMTYAYQTTQSMESFDPDEYWFLSVRIISTDIAGMDESFIQIRSYTDGGTLNEILTTSFRAVNIQEGHFIMLYSINELKDTKFTIPDWDDATFWGDMDFKEPAEYDSAEHGYTWNSVEYTAGIIIDNTVNGRSYEIWLGLGI